MVSIETIVGGIGVITGLGGFIFGGGMFNKMLAHNGATAIQKHELQQTKDRCEKNEDSINQLKTDVAMQGKDIQSFIETTKKLEMLPEISSKLTTLEAIMTVLREQIRDFRSERMDHDKNN